MEKLEGRPNREWWVAPVPAGGVCTQRLVFPHFWQVRKWNNWSMNELADKSITSSGLYSGFKPPVMATAPPPAPYGSRSPGHGFARCIISPFVSERSAFYALLGRGLLVSQSCTAALLCCCGFLVLARPGIKTNVCCVGQRVHTMEQGMLPRQSD